MAMTVERFTDPAQVLDRAGPFLGSEPVLHNLVLTLLHTNVAHPRPGRYWCVTENARPGGVVGVVYQSPLDFLATFTPMPDGAARAAAEAIVEDGVALPGINGEATTASRFAGTWAELRHQPVVPVEGQRIYELEEMVPAMGAPGHLRQAGPVDGDRRLLVAWTRAFEAEVGDCIPRHDPEEVVDRRLAAGCLWLWEHEGPASFAGHTVPVEGVARIGPVYTPPERRRHGYGSACVAGISAVLQSRGLHCILYTDLGNPTSNSCYRRIGYRATAELLRYRFG